MSARVRAGRRGARPRTARRPWPGSPTGGSGRRPGPHPVPRRGRHRRRRQTGPGRPPRRRDVRPTSRPKACRHGLPTSLAARRSRSRSGSCRSAGPRRSAKSSTPSTRGVLAGGSGTAITSRNNVDRLATAPSARASRDPARPAVATAMWRNMPTSGGVFRPCLTVSPATCSTNVPTPQSVLSHRKRRSRSRTSTCRPPIATSANVRSYLPCTRVEATPHRRQHAHDTCGAAQIRTTPLASSTRRTTTPARCGNRTSTPRWSSHSPYDHKPLNQPLARGQHDHQKWARSVGWPRTDG